MTFDTGLAAVALLLGRVLFGGFLAFQGVNHFFNREEMTAYANAKGIPAPGLGVLLSGTVLVVGGLGIVLGVFPTLAAAVLAVFFVVVTPTMHDFWAVPEDQQQDEMVNFLKNVELLGAALLFFALSTQPWGYALNLGL
jgi:putative oxidoreductase